VGKSVLILDWEGSLGFGNGRGGSEIVMKVLMPFVQPYFIAERYMHSGLAVIPHDHYPRIEFARKIIRTDSGTPQRRRSA
jgi:hypothetical protein